MDKLALRVAQRFAQMQDEEASISRPGPMAVAPPGWENTVKKMKKHKDEIDNPWALAWHMKNKGDKPGGKEAGFEQQFEEEEEQGAVPEAFAPKQESRFPEKDPPEDPLAAVRAAMMRQP